MTKSQGLFFIQLFTKQTRLLAVISLVLSSLISSTSYANTEPTLPPTSKQQEWLNDIIQNIDMSLFFRIQKNVMANMSLVGPYSQEYYQCLKAEGVIDENSKTQQNLTLEQLFEHVKAKGSNCHHIVKSLIGQMNFDFTEEEFEQGLSPKYQEKYRDLKNSI